MRKTIIALLIISVYGCIKTDATAQTRWIEQWISMGFSKPMLSEAWIENSQKQTIERRIIDYNSTSREHWKTLTRTAFDGSKETKTEMYSKHFGNGQKPTATILFDYDKYLRKVKTSVYYNLGKKTKDPVMYTIHIYDDKSNLVSETITTLLDNSGKPTEPQVLKREYRYKDTLLIEEWKVAKDQSIHDHFSYKYVSAGNKVEKKLLDKTDNLTKSLFTWKYDDSGRLIEDRVFFNNGEIFRRHKFIYNDTGDLVEQLEYGDERNEILVKVIYKYEVIDDEKKNSR